VDHTHVHQLFRGVPGRGDHHSTAGGSLIRLLDDITEPILGPLRRVLPTLGMIDISPIVAIILINFITGLLVSNIR